MSQRIIYTLGLFGPLYLGGTIVALTVLQYDFMRSLRWHPLDAPTLDWPSGLALGPLGVLMMAAFLISGACLIAFAVGARAVLRSRVAAMLLVGAGAALMLLALPTDPTYRDYPATWHGITHDAAFVLLGVTLLPAMLFLAWRWWNTGYGWYTLLTALIIIPCFVLKGILFYGFLAGVLLWFGLTARYLARQG